MAVNGVDNKRSDLRNVAGAAFCVGAGAAAGTGVCLLTTPYLNGDMPSDSFVKKFSEKLLNASKTDDYSKYDMSKTDSKGFSVADYDKNDKNLKKVLLERINNSKLGEQDKNILKKFLKDIEGLFYKGKNICSIDLNIDVPKNLKMFSEKYLLEIWDSRKKSLKEGCSEDVVNIFKKIKRGFIAKYAAIYSGLALLGFGIGGVIKSHKKNNCVTNK